MSTGPEWEKPAARIKVLFKDLLQAVGAWFGDFFDLQQGVGHLNGGRPM